MGSRLPRVDVLGVGISAIDMDGAVREITRFISEDERQYVCVRDVHGVMASQKDPVLMRIHNNSGITTPDGMPLVWAGRWAGAKHIQRVYGPDLLLEVCRTGLDKGWRHYLYGGGYGVAEDLKAALEVRFPGIDIVGTYTPPFRQLNERERDEVVGRINAAQPHLVWVGLSTPKQEHWMAEFRTPLKAPVLLGVGAAFDIHSGRISQAPRWIQRNGFEWLYRLAHEPRRLWKRYFFNTPAFVWKILRRGPRLLP